MLKPPSCTAKSLAGAWAFSGLWQDAQESLPEVDKEASKNIFFPSSATALNGTTGAFKRCNAACAAGDRAGLAAAGLSLPRVLWQARRFCPQDCRLPIEIADSASASGAPPKRLADAAQRESRNRIFIKVQRM